MEGWIRLRLFQARKLGILAAALSRRNHRQTLELGRDIVSPSRYPIGLLSV
jgi:hypothetical protein